MKLKNSSTSTERKICKHDSYLCNPSSFIQLNSVDVRSELQSRAHTVTADKDEFLTSLITDKQGRKQSEGSTEGMER